MNNLPSKRTWLKLARDAAAGILGLFGLWAAHEGIDVGPSIDAEGSWATGAVLVFLFFWRMLRDDVSATSSVLKR